MLTTLASPIDDATFPSGIRRMVRSYTVLFNSLYPGTSFQILLGGGGGKCPPQAIKFQDVFFIEFLNAWKRAWPKAPPWYKRHYIPSTYIESCESWQLLPNSIWLRVMLDCKKHRSDVLYSCPRDWRFLASWKTIWGFPWNPQDHNSTTVSRVVSPLPPLCRETLYTSHRQPISSFSSWGVTVTKRELNPRAWMRSC